MNFFLRILAFFSLASALSAFAACDSSTDAECAPCDDACYSRVSVGAQLYYYRLQIDGSAAGATATPAPFTGCLGGVYTCYEYMKPDNLYAALQASYAQGTVTTDGTGNNKRSVNDGLLETRFGYNCSLTDCASWLLTPYTGAGFHWNRQHRYPGALAGLTFNYYKIYIPLGIVLSYVPCDRIHVALDFEWMPDILSMVSLSSMQGSYWQLKRMNNYMVQLPCRFTFAERYELTITPFWMHIEDGASTAVTSGGMPLGLDQQTTNDWGGRISFGVPF